MAREKVKIVIPCADEGEWLRVTVDSVLSHTAHPSFEVVISANGDTCTDFSFLERPAYREKVRLLRFPEQLGTGISRNVAVEPGDADFYMFLDSHCLIDGRDWLERAIACLEEHPSASMVQPEIHTFRYGGEIAPGKDPDPALIDVLYKEYGFRWEWPYDGGSSLIYTETARLSEGPFEGMAGGGMVTIVRAERFHRLGMFDPEVGGWHFESLDYCLGAWLRGHPTLVDPGIRVFHLLKKARSVPISEVDPIHGYLRTAYKYLSPRRRDLAEILLRRLGRGEAVDEALRRIGRGNWMAERVAFLKERVHDDDWLFRRFEVYEEHAGIYLR